MQNESQTKTSFLFSISQKVFPLLLLKHYSVSNYICQMIRQSRQQALMALGRFPNKHNNIALSSDEHHQQKGKNAFLLDISEKHEVKACLHKCTLMLMIQVL